MSRSRKAFQLALALVLCVGIVASAAVGETDGSRCEGGVCAQADVVVELTRANEVSVLRAPLVLVELCTPENPACTNFAADYAAAAQALAGTAVVAHADVFGDTEIAQKTHPEKTPSFLLFLNGSGAIPYLEEPSTERLVRWVASYADYRPVLLQSADEVAAFVADTEDARGATPVVACFDPLPLEPGATADARLFEATLFMLGAQKNVVHAYVRDPALVNASRAGVAVLHSRAFDRPFTFDFGDTAALQTYADTLRSTTTTSSSSKGDTDSSSDVSQETKRAALMGFIESRRLPPFDAVSTAQLHSYHASGLPVFFVLVRKTPRAGFRSWFTRLAVNNSDRFLIGYLDLSDSSVARTVGKTLRLGEHEYPLILHMRDGHRHILAKGFTRASARAFIERCLAGTERAVLRSAPVPPRAATDTLVQPVVGATFYDVVVDPPHDVALLVRDSRREAGDADAAQRVRDFAAAARVLHRVCGARLAFAAVDVGANEALYDCADGDAPCMVYVAKRRDAAGRAHAVPTVLPGEYRYGALVRRGAMLCGAELDEARLMRTDARYAEDVAAQWMRDLLHGRDPGPKPPGND